MDRRHFAAALAALPLTAASLTSARAQVRVEDLMKPAGNLPDVVMGSADAKATIIEYASMTCSHCAHFNETTWPDLKKKYIDTGKVRFIMREFPLDPLAAGGFMLARCSGDKREAMIDLLFRQQRNWAFVEKPVDALAALVKQAGFTQESFEKCLTDQKLLDGVLAVKNQGQNDFKVDATPTFFINGNKYPGAMSIDEFDKILSPIVGN
ncbi:DsbA family protein [Terrarubrum flagellatum]|uniref:DsbA family protein n=1 Tax=Terrirubrum flagellatum TaxID=2895980 RepID=UPI0031453538